MNPEKPQPPSKHIKDEMQKRGWTQADLAYILGRYQNDVHLLVSGKKRITPETAQEIAIAFGTTPEYWLNLENKYRLAQLEDVDTSVSRKAKLFNSLPAKEIIKRGWVSATDDINELEAKFLDFFEISSLDEKPSANYAARKSNSYFETPATEVAWLMRARQLANAVMVKKFSDKSLTEAYDKLCLLLFNVEEIRQIPKILAEAGIRFLIIEPLPNSKIDGVTFWLDKNSPVIVLSLRFDRIDSFWHTLLHELDHVKNREGQDTPIIDFDLLGEDSQNLDKPDFEKRADKEAAEFSIPPATLDSFIMRTHPTYTDQKILGFSALNKVHAGILVGQLHHRYTTTGKGLPFTHGRKFLVKIRHIINDSALTDGYGYQPLI